MLLQKAHRTETFKGWGANAFQCIYMPKSATAFSLPAGRLPVQSVQINKLH
jgi:hypothetical protein